MNWLVFIGVLEIIIGVIFWKVYGILREQRIAAKAELDRMETVKKNYKAQTTRNRKAAAKTEAELDNLKAQLRAEPRQALKEWMAANFDEAAMTFNAVKWDQPKKKPKKEKPKAPDPRGFTATICHGRRSATGKGARFSDGGGYTD